MTEIKTAPVRAQRVDDIDTARDVPGAFKFYSHGERDPAGLIYCCPCGCRRLGSLMFRPPVDQHPSWEWDGNMDAPTLTPSVDHIGHWHGHLTGGVWISV